MWQPISILKTKNIPVAWPGNLGLLVPHTEAESYLQVPL